ncbi:MAG: hypothetical protein H6Q96_1078 [Nitrospirae bacterium]|nr:hypothetical protein [Nitrospirota bacterium]
MSEYDGITEREEGKKKMPLGMTVLFMGLIICGLVYMYLFMPQTTGWSQAGRYEAKVKAREAARLMCIRKRNISRWSRRNKGKRSMLPSALSATEQILKGASDLPSKARSSNTELP